MSVLKINPMEISGPWVAGWVLDYHSLSAVPTGDPYHPFEMTYTELGSRLYRFKYRADATAIEDLADTVEEFLAGKPWRSILDAVVPTPPSIARANQPVAQLVQLLAGRLGVPSFGDGLRKIEKTPSMKNVDDWFERQRILARAVQAGQDEVRGKSILLLDDLIQSGATLRRSGEVLLNDAGARAVYAVVLTRTR